MTTSQIFLVFGDLGSFEEYWARYFVDCPSVRISLIYFLMIRLELWVLGV